MTVATNLAMQAPCDRGAGGDICSTMVELSLALGPGSTADPLRTQPSNGDRDWTHDGRRQYVTSSGLDPSCQQTNNVTDRLLSAEDINSCSISMVLTADRGLFDAVPPGMPTVSQINANGMGEGSGIPPGCFNPVADAPNISPAAGSAHLLLDRSISDLPASASVVPQTIYSSIDGSSVASHQVRLVGPATFSPCATGAVSDNPVEVVDHAATNTQPITAVVSDQWADDVERLAGYVPDCLEKFGFCVVDRFAGRSLSLAVLNEVVGLYERESFEDGLLTSQAVAATAVRGDRVFWLEREDDASCANIYQLIRRLDSVFLRLRGRLGSYHICSRSKAMIACYPGQGRCYRRHVDNPNQDGRAITTIYYINKSWKSQRDGGILRMYPSQLGDNSVDIEPLFDRILFFWSDGRTPHEVLPAYKDRYAITVWYFNDEERQQARLRYLQQGGHVDNSPRLTSVALPTVAANH